MNSITGKIHSFQSLGTVDGPGVRYVVFMQGCPLKCGCCHNPDAMSIDGGKDFTAEQIVANVCRYTEYFGTDGGITVSGGEPLLQAPFVKELFSLCKKSGINTCLDTSGCMLNEQVLCLLDYTDRVLLDVKYTDNQLYLEHVGCSISPVLTFLETLNEKKIKTTIRQVIIPTLNDDKDNIFRLKKIVKKFACVDKIELLPFKKICQVKYDNLNLAFPFGHLPTPTEQQMQELNALLND